MTVLSRAFPLALVASAVLGAAGAHAAQQPAGQFYKLTVSSSFKAPFADCWAFSSNGRFILSHAGLGSFPYQLTGLNTVAGHFQAIWEGRNSIGFSGITNGSTITGDGVDSYDRTYRYTGNLASSCGAADATAQGFVTR
jgi:hypothetical protein